MSCYNLNRFVFPAGEGFFKRVHYHVKLSSSPLVDFCLFFSFFTFFTVFTVRNFHNYYRNASVFGLPKDDKSRLNLPPHY